MWQGGELACMHGRGELGCVHDLGGGGGRRTPLQHAFPTWVCGLRCMCAQKLDSPILTKWHYGTLTLALQRS